MKNSSLVKDEYDMRPFMLREKYLFSNISLNSISNDNNLRYGYVLDEDIFYA